MRLRLKEKIWDRISIVIFFILALVAIAYVALLVADLFTTQTINGERHY